MRLLYAGTPDVAVPALRALLGSRHDVVAVLTRPDAPAGRGRQPTASPVARAAEAAGLEVLRPTSLRAESFRARLRDLRLDCVAVVAYGALVPTDLLAIPAHGWVNLHFSLLPAWRGAAPVQHALLAGDDLVGACTFRLVEELDAGPVFGAVTERVRPTDTAGDLLYRLAGSGADLLVATVDGIAAGSLSPRPQPADGVTRAPRLTTGDARVRWAHPAFAVDRRIRACTPTPGAWTTFRGERLKVLPLRAAGVAAGAAEGAADAASAAGPGQLVVSRDGVLVGTGTEPVRLDRVQPAGRRPMPATDWARGAQLEPGVTFGGAGE